MRKLLMTAIYMFSISLIIGQDDVQEVWSTWFIKPLHGKANQLEKGLIDHVKNIMDRENGQNIILRS